MYACPDVVQPDQLREPSNAKPTSPANPWEARHPSGPTHFYLPVTHVSSKDSHSCLLRGRETFLGSANVLLDQAEVGTSRSDAASPHPAHNCPPQQGEIGWRAE